VYTLFTEEPSWSS